MQSDVGEFIAARSDRLLRTAYLLTGDRERAEELLQDALSRVWSTWARSELGPDLSACRELVRGMPSRWRRRHNEPASEVLAALDRLSRRQRAALVLTEVDGLSQRELAGVLECTEPVAARLVARARAAYGIVDATALDQVTIVEDPSDATTLAQRLGHVERRVGARRRWHRVELIASLALATAAAAFIGVVTAAGGGEDHALPAPDTNKVKPPPIIVGHQLPPILHVDDVNYEYDNSVVSRAGESRVRVIVPPTVLPQAVTWVTPWTFPGKVKVLVDDRVIYRGGPGPLGDGAVLTSGRSHIVVLAVRHTLPGTRLGLAIYHWPRA